MSTKSNAKKETRRGITLIETLVCFAILSILIAIVLVAIQQARATAKKLSCANNLKQIGLALISYEATHRVLPGGSNGEGFSALAMILPYIEQSNVYNNINFNTRFATIPSLNSANNTAFESNFACFVCPSNKSENFQSTCYSLNGGFGDQSLNFVGTFCDTYTRNRKEIMYNDIQDGLANTFAATEWRLGTINKFDTSTVVYDIPEFVGDQPYTEFVSSCMNASMDNSRFGAWSKEASWYLGSMGNTILNFNLNVNSKSCTYNTSYGAGAWTTGSIHAKGVNAIMHDGHVAFIDEKININILRSLSSRASSDNF